MNSTDSKNFKVQETSRRKSDEENAGGTCAISNTVCNPGDECMTGLVDKTGAI